MSCTHIYFSQVVLATAGILTGLFLFDRVFSISSRSLPLPPGPKGHWLFGIKNQLPRKEPWKAYVSWAKSYAEPVISFAICNRTVIVVNDLQSISDLLERRAGNTSDRPEQYMSHQVCGRSKTVFNITSRDPRHKVYRRLVQQGLGPRSTKTYWPILQEELEILLQGLAESPQNYVQHVRRNFVGIIMRVTYGFSISSLNDTFVQVADETAAITDKTMAPGSWMVDYYPILRYLPSFFPGGDFKRKGKVWRDRLRYLSDVPHQWVKNKMASGNYSESFTSSLLIKDGVPVSQEEEDIVRWCAGGLYVGASDTTVSAITSFILLMASHPEVQGRAQAELDEICGRDQLPQPAQLGSLTYLLAVLKEVLRFAPVSNLALPHKVIEDDEYHGFRIPKGATIMGNIWAIMHDPSIFPNPDVFSPERFLEVSSQGQQSPPSPSQPDPRQWAFGFGRRACPGIYFSETSLLLVMAGILSRFNIGLPPNTAAPKISFTTGLLSHVEPFDICVTPRAEVFIKN